MIGRRIPVLILFAALLAVGVSAFGKTLVLDATVCDKMAAIADSAPRLSWATYEPWTAVFYTSLITMVQGHEFLIRYPLEKIPAGQRITHAEWVVPVSYIAPADVRFYVWRILADWGPGVCHVYRMTRPEKIKWTMAGARGNSSDRATRPTAIKRLTAAGEQVINVTEDVELWYTGAAPNNGWLVTIEDSGTVIYFPSPEYDQPAAWKLRITYEPE